MALEPITLTGFRCGRGGHPWVPRKIAAGDPGVCSHWNRLRIRLVRAR